MPGPAGRHAARAARAARTSVPPVLMRSSTMMQVAPATSPTNRSPETTPALRCFSAKALPIGRPIAASRASRSRSARFPPPRSGEMTQSGSSPTIALICIDQQGRRRQRHGAAAKRILESRLVVYFERDHGIAADRLEKRRDVTRRHRIVRLGAAILSRITEIGRDCGYPPGPGIFQRADEEQQPAELVVGALVRAAVKAVDHVDVGAGNGIEWSCLVLAVFEIPLFMRAERMRQQLADIAPEIVGSVQGE